MVVYRKREIQCPSVKPCHPSSDLYMYVFTLASDDWIVVLSKNYFMVMQYSIVTMSYSIVTMSDIKLSLCNTIFKKKETPYSYATAWLIYFMYQEMQIFIIMVKSCVSKCVLWFTRRKNIIHNIINKYTSEFWPRSYTANHDFTYKIWNIFPLSYQVTSLQVSVG